MTTIPQDVVDEFCRKLAAEKAFDEQMISSLRNLLEADKKPKAAEVVEVLTGQSGRPLP